MIADNDLTYHHVVEVAFGGVAYLTTPIEFFDPVFRAPLVAEVDFARRQLGGDLAGPTVFAWDIDGGPCFLAAEAVEVCEGLVKHHVDDSAGDCDGASH